MQRPRTAAGRAGVAALLADPASALVALDYDGTLAPIVVDPAQAVAAAGAPAALAALAVRGVRLVVVTGRPAATAVELGGFGRIAGLVVLGQYGLERWAHGQLTSPEPMPGLPAARSALSAMGLAYEDKGLSLVVHTRSGADPLVTQAALLGPLTELGRRVGLDVHAGRLVIELRPPGFDKRGALLAAADPLPGAVVYAGDDVGDGPAFDAVDELRTRGVPGLTVFSDSTEGPAALRERADLVVDGPEGVVRLLSGMAAAR